MSREIQTVSLPEDVVEKSKKFSEETGRTFSGLVRISLQEKLQREDATNGK